MNIVVNYSSQLRQLSGVSSEQIEIEAPCSLQTLVTRLVEKHGEGLRGILLEPHGNLRSSILAIVNDIQVHWQIAVQLQDGDVVTFLSPLAGG
jgi:molybdopterin converting factor small subunit